MPASITARSSSTLASSRAMRLKPMLTWRISLVIVVLVEARVELALADAAGGERQVACSGWLISRAIADRAEHGGEQRDADPDDQVVPGDIGPTRVGSACSQYGSLARSRSRPTGPAVPFIELATSGVGAELVAQLALDHAL